MSNSNNGSSDQPTIPPAVSKQLVSNHGSKTSTTKRVSPEAAEAISEALRLFVCHAHRRASIEAECDDEEEFKSINEGKHNESSHTPIDAHHITRIAADLLMDFS